MKTPYTLALACLLLTSVAQAQQAAPPAEFKAGMPLGVTTEGKYTPVSSNVKVFGALVNTESCSYDESRGLIVAVSRGADQRFVTNDGFISLINHDGSVHTPLWIGATRNGLVLNHPNGSDIENGKLYVADRDGGTADGTPSVSVVRMFDMKTGAPAGEIKVAESTGFNDIEVAKDGTIYASQTGSATVAQRIYKITPDGKSQVLIEGAPLAMPNGVALDNDGNVVVVNIGDAAVLTFSSAGKLLKTEQAAQAGNDGLVILPNGTKFVSSVRLGGVSRIRPGKPAELIATGIPSAASMC
jgi:outer membrane protein assembly factor BamB